MVNERYTYLSSVDVMKTDISPLVAKLAIQIGFLIEFTNFKARRTF